MNIDGQRQRRALTAAEQALEALHSGDGDRAGAAAARAAELDQIGAFAALPGAVNRAAADLAAGGSIGRESVEALAAAVGPGPLLAAVERLAGGSSSSE